MEPNVTHMTAKHQSGHEHLGPKAHHSTLHYLILLYPVKLTRDPSACASSFLYVADELTCLEPRVQLKLGWTDVL
jgi:hypothetical protein